MGMFTGLAAAGNRGVMGVWVGVEGEGGKGGWGGGDNGVGEELGRGGGV